MNVENTPVEEFKEWLRPHVQHREPPPFTILDRFFFNMMYIFCYASVFGGGPLTKL